MAPTWKQIEARRETRLWLTQVVLPAVFAAGTAWSIPEVRVYVGDKYAKAKTWVKGKIDEFKNK